jgi:NADPH:quinone reductase-like Zn-dependent oxidoreductase
MSSRSQSRMPARGKVRVAVRAVGVNPIDWERRSGAMAQFMAVEFPSVPGEEVAGVVDEVGDGVSDVAVGDEVFGFAVGGGAAEYALVDHYAGKPAGLSWAEAAGVPAAAETAVRALDLLGVGADQTVLVNGAAGGVGTAAVQFARARGARVIGTASQANHEYLRTLGAEPTTYGGAWSAVFVSSPLTASIARWTPPDAARWWT